MIQNILTGFYKCRLFSYIPFFKLVFLIPFLEFTIFQYILKSVTYQFLDNIHSL